MDTGEIAGVGTADDAPKACALAARGNPNLGVFVPHFGSQRDDFDLKHLVVNVYDVSDLGDRATREHVDANGSVLDENRLVGTFAARYED